MHDRSDSGAITADNLLARQDDRWMEYREKLERALPDAPILELTIQSSATLIKGEKI